MKILCVLAKYQYGVPERGLNTEYFSFIPALKRLGHTVVHFDSWDRKRYSDFSELNKALLDTVESERPDILLSVQCQYEIWTETWDIIKARADVATISWATDDSWKYREVSRFIAKHFHAMTTTYKSCVDKYKEDGIENILLTQWAAQDSTEPLKARECKYQVSFVGAAHGQRKAKIKKLLAAGIKVNCFGYGWGNGPVSDVDMCRIFNTSMISLNFSNSKGENQIKARTFEVPGAGGFLLTEYSAELDKYYTLDKEVVCFHNDAELINKIKYYLTNPDLRNDIARKGFTRTMNEHTYDMRMREVLDFALQAHKKYNKNNSKEQIHFSELKNKHRLTFKIKLFRYILLALCTCIWGKKRGRRAARRIVFELSWRLCGARTFSAAGLPGIMFSEI